MTGEPSLLAKELIPSDREIRLTPFRPPNEVPVLLSPSFFFLIFTSFCFPPTINRYAFASRSLCCRFKLKEAIHYGSRILTI